MKTTKKVAFGGKAYDIDKLDELAALQAVFVPEQWPLPKKDGVRLFVNLQGMLATEFSRHFAHNFKNLLAVAMQQQTDGEGSKVPVSFKFELDFSALNVAAFAKPGMSFSRKYSTEGKPKSHDINQGDFLSEDGLEVSLDTKSLDEEMAPEPEPTPPEEGKEELPKSDKPKKSRKKKADKSD